MISYSYDRRPVTAAGEFTLFEVSGNLDPKRLGKVFPSGWSPLTPKGKTPALIAASKFNANQVKGTTVKEKGPISKADVIKKTQEWD